MGGMPHPNFTPPPFPVAPGQKIAPLFKPGRGPPMTAAERQRRCRANGKGRHRGGGSTPAQRQAAKRYAVEMLLAAMNGEAAAPPPAPAETAAASPPAIDWGISAMAA